MADDTSRERCRSASGVQSPTGTPFVKYLLITNNTRDPSPVAHRGLRVSHVPLDYETDAEKAEFLRDMAAVTSVVIDCGKPHDDPSDYCPNPLDPSLFACDGEEDCEWFY